MEKSYGHMGMEERAVIQANLKLGLSLRAIGRELGRAASTISRELKRCGWRGPDVSTPAWPAVGRGVNGYWCEAAHRRALKMAAKPRVARTGPTPGSQSYGCEQGNLMTSFSIDLNCYINNS